MHSPSDDTANHRTLYVGNLDPSVSEELLMALFTQMGPCNNCKIIYDPTGDPYAFVEFTEHQAAAHALLAMNKRLVMGREIKVNWATTSTNAANKIDTSKHHHIFVGDLAPEIEQAALFEAFSPFGEISEVKIAKFPDTQKSKGYAFIAFTNQNDAETAIASMNGQWLGTRKIRTNWATRKASTNETASTTRYQNPTNNQYGTESSAPRLDYNEVWNRTGDTNSTVYFGGCTNVNEELVRSIFAPFGNIKEIRIFKEKGYAFVRFTSKENACQAICHLHGLEMNGFTIKCGWGRDESTNDRNNSVDYGGNVNQNYYNNQYDSYPQNSFGPPSNNNFRANDRAAFGNYGGSYQQYFPNSQQWNNNNNNHNHNNMNSQQSDSMRNSYPQSTGDAGRWNDSYSYGQNFNQYKNPQQSHMYSSNSNWGSSRR